MGLMNELQQVLLIFAVVVIAGLYFLSRSRQNTIKKNSSQDSKTPAQTEHTIQDDFQIDAHNASLKSQEQAADALNNLGNPHIPLSESTEKRIIEARGFSNPDMQVQNAMQPVTPESVSNDAELNENQGVLSFGEEFDLPKSNSQTVENAAGGSLQIDETNIQNPELEPVIDLEQTQTIDNGSTDNNSQGKHHVLVVDDPGMTGEVDEQSVPADFVKPSFGIPEEETVKKTVISSTNKKPEVFVIMVLSTGQEFAMTDVNQALLGVGLTYSDQAIFVKNDNMGNAFIKVANMLEPGTFPVENLESYATPGIAMILELPTTVRAPAAMHDLIMMARKINQRLKGRLYDMERHLIKESDLQSMRDAALDYESEPIA